jgi:hypothetical protein
VILACTALAAWSALGGGAPAQETHARALLLQATELPLDQVNKISFEHAGSPPLVFERTGVRWMQTAPYAHPADPIALRQVLEAAAELEQTRVVDLQGTEPAQRAALGLHPAQAVLRVSWPGGERALELGKRTVAGRAWVRVRGRPNAASVNAALHQLTVDGDPRQWRAMTLYDPEPGDAERIVLQYGGGASWTLQRQGARWRVTAPYETRADSDAVRGYIESAARAQADAFAADQPTDWAAFGLAPALASVHVARAGGGAEGIIEIGTPVAQGAAERFARVDGRPAALQVGAKALLAILPPPAFFVDPRGTDVVPADVRRIVYTPAPGTTLREFSLDRVRDSWTLSEGKSAEQAVAANGESVRRLLTQLAETRAPEVSFSEIPAELRVGQFTLYGEGGAQLAVIRVAREAAEGTGKWALDNQDNVLRVFPQNYDIRLDAASYTGRR